MNKAQATKGLGFYKNFVSQTKKQEQIFQNAKNNLDQVNIPKFKVVAILPDIASGITCQCARGLFELSRI
jgi:hypothetical protein